MKSLLLASAAVVFAAAFNNDICETVLVKGKDGEPLRVNKSDYDADHAEGGEKKYTLHAADKKDQPEPVVGDTFVPVHPELTIPPAPSAPDFVNPVAPSTANNDTYMVAKHGTGKTAKFFVVRADGTKIEDFRDVDAEGYKTEQEAWAAIMAVKQQPHEQQIAPPPNMPEAPAIV